VEVIFSGGGNQSTRRKPPTCSKSLVEEEVGVDKKKKKKISLIAIIPIVQDLACHNRIFKMLTLFYTYNVYEDKKHISIRFVHIRFKDW
jgi:hypothetical protein